MAGRVGRGLIAPPGKWAVVGIGALLLSGVGSRDRCLAASTEAIWTGAAGLWSDPTGWNQGAGPIPDNGQDGFNVFVDGGNGVTASSVTLNLDVTVDSFSIDAGDMLSIDDGRTLSLDGNGAAVLSNDGKITLAAAARPTSLRPIDQLILSGNGILQLTDQNHSQITGSHVESQLIQQLGHRIQGAGKIGLNHMRLVNHGAIDATESSKSLTIDTSGTLANNFNSGVIRELDDAHLIFNASKVTNFQTTGQG